MSVDLGQIHHLLLGPSRKPRRLELYTSSDINLGAANL
jgi:hypothetical protein